MAEFEEISKALEDMKQTVADLKKAKEDGDRANETKIAAIQSDLDEKMKGFEAKRKGRFSGAEEDEDRLNYEYRKSGSIDLLVNSKSVSEQIVELQKANDNILVVSQVLGLAPNETKIYQDYVGVNPLLKTAMNTGVSGDGSEWIPAGYSPRLFDKIRLELKVAALHETINMPTAVYQPPVVTSDATAYLVAERTGADDTLTSGNRIPASNPGTGNFTLTARKLAGRVVFSEELTEDSIVPVLPLVNRQIVRSIANAVENCVINGDTTGTHMDSDVTSSSDARKAWKGYRKLALSGAKVDIGTFNGDAMLSIRKKMGKYGVSPANLCWVCGISGFSQLLNLKDSSGNVLVTTVDKYGAGATIHAGELGRLWGSPIIVSEYIRENLNASGVYDATTTTKTEILCVYTPGFLIGDRRTLKIKTAEEITTDQTVLVATVRKAFASPYNESDDYTVGVGYNLTT